MQLAEATWTSVADCDIDAVVMPIGSTEQHGPHAPLGTDTVLASAVADRALAETRFNVAVAPAIPIGVSAEHRRFAGTMWVGEDAFRAFVTDAVGSLADHDVDHVVLVNGHGGNVPALGEVAATVNRSTAIRCVAFTWFDAIDTGDLAMGHAGPVETAALLASRPELVDRNRLAVAGDDAAGRWGIWIGGTNVAVDTDEFAANGVVGDPRAGDADTGEELLSAAADQLCAVIEYLVTA